MDPSYERAIERTFRCASSFIREVSVVLMGLGGASVQRRVALTVLHRAHDDAICFAWCEPGTTHPVLVLASEAFPTPTDAVVAFLNGLLPAAR